MLLDELLPAIKQPPFGFPESFLNETYECFVASLSEEDDDLGQWRAYGSGEGGFALGFKPSIAQELLNTTNMGDVDLVPVVYKADDQRAIVFKFLEKLVVLFKAKSCWLESERGLRHGPPM